MTTAACAMQRGPAGLRRVCRQPASYVLHDNKAAGVPDCPVCIECARTWEQGIRDQRVMGPDGRYLPGDAVSLLTLPQHEAVT